MLNKVYLYAVGAVLVLGLVMPFDAKAGNLQICINGTNLQGQACNIGNNNNRNTNNRIKATGYDALDIIVSGSEITSGVSDSGWSYFVVRYQGSRFINLRNRIFSCKVSPDASNFECFSWPVHR
jgi:hypothetical protein